MATRLSEQLKALEEESQVYEALRNFVSALDEECDGEEAKLRELDGLLEECELAKRVVLCAQISSRCRQAVSDILDQALSLCSKREVHTLLSEVMRVFAKEEEVKWSCLFCVVNALSQALRGIERKKHLYVLSSAALHRLICEKAAKQLVALAASGRDDSEEEEEQEEEGRGGKGGVSTVAECRTIVVRIMEDTALVTSELGGEANDSSVSAKKSRREFKFHCLRLLGSVYDAVLALEEDQWNVWQGVMTDALFRLGVVDLRHLVLDSGDGVTDEEDSGAEETYQRDQLLGASLVIEKILDGPHSEEFLQKTTCADLSKMASFYFGKMLEYVQAEQVGTAALNKALHLLFLFMVSVEQKGGLKETFNYQEKVLGDLMRIMSYFPDKQVRAKARFCMKAVFSSLDGALRCRSLCELIESCEYPSVRATLLQMMKDEVAAAWPSKEGIDRKSPFLGRPAITCLLGPMYNSRKQMNLRERKDYLEDHGDEVLASMNALRFLLIKEQNQKEEKNVTFVLDPGSLNILSNDILPATEEAVQSILNEPGSDMFKFFSGACGGPGSNCGPDMGQDMGQRSFMNTIAMESVISRIKEILTGNAKPVTACPECPP